MSKPYSWKSAEFQHLLQRHRNTYRLPETSDDVERHFRQIMDYVGQLVRQARLDERQWLAELPDELEERIANLLYRLPYDIREASGTKDEAYRYQLIQENAGTYLRNCIRLAMGERERQARLDEHRILATLDEEGRKQRYLELHQE